MLVELTLRAERDIPAESLKSLRLFSLGLMPSFPANWEYRVETCPGTFAEGRLSGAKTPTELPLAPFGAVALTPNNLAEPVLISHQAEPLTVRLDNVAFRNCRERLAVLLPKQSWRKGEERKFAFAIQLVQQPVDSAAALTALKQERMNRAATVSHVSSGIFAQSRFVLDFAAESGAAAWTQAAWHGRDPLPLRISKLHTTWSALFFDGTVLHPLPVDATGTALYALTLNRKANVAAGHPVLADDPELRMEFAGVSERGVSLHLHNPARQPKNVKLRSNPAFGGAIPAFQCRIRLNPGTGMWITAKDNRLFIDRIK